MQFFVIIIFLILYFKGDTNVKPKKLFEMQEWKPIDCILIFVSSYLILFLLFMSKSIPVLKEIYKFTYLSYLQFFLLSIIFLLIFKLKLRQKFSALGLNTQNLKANIFMGLRVFSLIASIESFLTLILLLSGRESSLDLFPNESLKAVCQASLAIIIWGPVMEEFMFRGLMYSQFRKKFGVKSGIFLLSLVFAAWHFPATGTSILVSGIVLAYLYEKSQSLIPSIIFHGLRNLFLWFETIYSKLGKDGIILTNEKVFILVLTIILFGSYFILKTWNPEIKNNQN
ncbi:MAG: CAAX amino terminal protease family protein [Nitrospirae bacterium]|nr:MAG: CAAX amino terminal protease family protein [Nitrospirota bacterium]